MNNNNNDGDGSSGSPPPPYSYEERILWMPSGEDDSVTIRLELLAEWNPSLLGRVHPFTNLQSRLFPRGNDDDANIEAWIQISSRSISEIPRNGIHMIPILSSGSSGSDEISKTILRGPSGFWITLNRSCDENVFRSNKSWIKQLIQNRLITTPISKSLGNVGENKGGIVDEKWDMIESCDTSQQQDNNREVQQLILPNNGQGWSLDALQQSLSSMNIPLESTFLGKRSVLEWSNLLVSQNANSKTMWWNLRQNDKNDYMFRFGLEYSASSSTATHEKEFVAKLIGSQSMLGPRNAYQVSSPSTSRTVPELKVLSSPSDIATAGRSEGIEAWLKVEQVLRQPSLHQGRLETWIETTKDATTHCKHGRLSFRQVLPPVITPSWQSLQISGGKATSQTVSWLDDGTSILEVEFDFKDLAQPDTTMSIISLDVSAAYLTMDDFPGDPNRGRELPPARLQCIAANAAATNANVASSNYYEVYSSSVVVLPPVPDMSMPFNVLSLTCSLFAYLIGSLLIVLIKKGSENIVYALHPEKKPKRPIEKLKEKLSKLKQRLLKRRGKVEDNDDKSKAPSEEKEVTSEQDDGNTETQED